MRRGLSKVWGAGESIYVKYLQIDKGCAGVCPRFQRAGESIYRLDIYK